MEKITFIAILCFILLGCSSDDHSDRFMLQGQTYELTNYIIENSVDLNDDGVFSNDLLLERNCFVNSLFFREDNRVGDPASHSLSARVEYDSNGIPFQTTNCGHGDGALLNYELDRIEVEIWYFDDQVIFSGELSENGEILTLILPNERLLRDEFLYEDGTVEDYGGAVTAIYRRID